jgi:16S rRNA (cytosine1402-N4)-methyltransferase
MSHIPVMLEKSLELLNVRSGLVYVDVTAGGGGHLDEILRRAGPSGTVIGIDRDLSAIEALRGKLGSGVRLAHANYEDLESVVAEIGVDTITGGILADLGVSSMQLSDPDRGFSFTADGPLDMRMDRTGSVTAADLVNNLPEHELAAIIFKYGEERLSRKIARKIVEARPLTTTAQLASIVSRCVKQGRGPLRDASHPATRTFQALRIAVNGELDSLAKFLRSSLRLLAPGARLVVITFHSLEDRLVKQIFRQASASCICPPRQPVCTCTKRPELLIITPKPLVPEASEVLANPRSRSAKLRAGEKTA